MDVIQFIRDEIKFGHEQLDGIMQDLTPEVIQWTPSGTANGIGSLLAHVVMGQDNAVNRALKGGESVFLSGGWAEKTGIPPERGGVWRKDWTLNLDAFKEYMAAQRVSVLDWLDSANVSDFDREIEWGNGPRPAWWIVHSPMTTHVFLHAGEISTLKGMQGLKGLPF